MGIQGRGIGEDEYSRSFTGITSGRVVVFLCGLDITSTGGVKLRVNIPSVPWYSRNSLNIFTKCQFHHLWACNFFSKN